MRLIERQMVAALKGRRNWQKDNTTVTWEPYGEARARVYLFGHLIATYGLCDAELQLYDAGYRTATTKSRLNALLGAFAPGRGIFQRDYAWYVTSNVDDDTAIEPWTGTASFQTAG